VMFKMLAAVTSWGQARPQPNCEQSCCERLFEFDDEFEFYWRI
jgi:hypothetical protein